MSMSHTDILIRKGQLAELREKRSELLKKFERCRGDVVQYCFPGDPLNPVETCRIDLAQQAITDLVEIKAEYLKVEAAISELGG